VISSRPTAVLCLPCWRLFRRPGRRARPRRLWAPLFAILLLASVAVPLGVGADAGVPPLLEARSDRRATFEIGARPEAGGGAGDGDCDRRRLPRPDHQAFTGRGGCCRTSGRILDAGAVRHLATPAIRPPTDAGVWAAVGRTGKLPQKNGACGSSAILPARRRRRVRSSWLAPTTVSPPRAFERLWVSWVEQGDHNLGDVPDPHAVEHSQHRRLPPSASSAGRLTAALLRSSAASSVGDTFQQGSRKTPSGPRGCVGDLSAESVCRGARRRSTPRSGGGASPGGRRVVLPAVTRRAAGRPRARIDRTYGAHTLEADWCRARPPQVLADAAYQSPRCHRPLFSCRLCDTPSEFGDVTEDEAAAALGAVLETSLTPLDRRSDRPARWGGFLGADDLLIVVSGFGHGAASSFGKRLLERVIGDPEVKRHATRHGARRLPARPTGAGGGRAGPGNRGACVRWSMSSRTLL